MCEKYAMAPKPIPERAEAKRLGHKTYFTGKKCVNGHLSARFASNHKCLACNKATLLAYRKESPKYRAWLHRTKVARAEKYNGWKENNRRDYRAYARSHYLMHIEKMRARSQDYRAKNPEKVKGVSEKRRAQKFGAEGVHTADAALALLKKQRHKCAYCKADLRKVQKHKDHITALSRGGTNYISNIQWLCGPCNSRKGARDPIEFARTKGLLL